MLRTTRRARDSTTSLLRLGALCAAHVHTSKVTPHFNFYFVAFLNVRSSLVRLPLGRGAQLPISALVSSRPCVPPKWRKGLSAPSRVCVPMASASSRGRHRLSTNAAAEPSAASPLACSSRASESGVGSPGAAAARMEAPLRRRAWARVAGMMVRWWSGVVHLREETSHAARAVWRMRRRAGPWRDGRGSRLRSLA